MSQPRFILSREDSEQSLSDLSFTGEVSRPKKAKKKSTKKKRSSKDNYRQLIVDEMEIGNVGSSFMVIATSPTAKKNKTKKHTKKSKKQARFGVVVLSDCEPEEEECISDDEMMAHDKWRKAFNMWGHSSAYTERTTSLSEEYSWSNSERLSSSLTEFSMPKKSSKSKKKSKSKSSKMKTKSLHASKTEQLHNSYNTDSTFFSFEDDSSFAEAIEESPKKSSKKKSKKQKKSKTKKSSKSSSKNKDDTYVFMSGSCRF